jgi:hypothetical protein
MDASAAYAMVSPSPTPTANMTTPTRRAVDYLREKWRRVKKTNRKTVGHFNLSSSPSMRRPSGVCNDRKQLADVADDDDITIFASGESGSTTPASSFVEGSPLIQDSEWRRFTDTGVKSSPSTFLGPWSNARLKNSTSHVELLDEKSYDWQEKQQLTPSPEDSQDTSSLTKSDDMSDIYNATPRRMHSNSQLQFPVIDVTVAMEAHASMWHVSHGLPEAKACKMTAAARLLSISTNRSRPGSKRDEHADSYTHKPKPENRTLPTSKRSSLAVETDANGDDTASEDRWSFISALSDTATNDLQQHDTGNLPPAKRRKVSPFARRVSSPLARPPLSANTEDHDRDPQQQKNHKYQRLAEATPPAPRNHPRYLTSYSSNAQQDAQLRTRRVLNFRQGSAVLMPMPSSGIGA